jgi:hypothetical protein
MYSLNSHKPILVRVVTILILLLVIMGIALPASATSPEKLNFTFTDVTYYDLPADTGYGTWSASGLFTAAGSNVEDPNHSGWDPDGCWRAVHSVDTLTDGATGGTITIRSQVTKIAGATYCASFSAEVHWVIVSGTGAYANLHGQGDGTASGYLEFTDTGLNYVLTYQLLGDGHFD